MCTRPARTSKAKAYIEERRCRGHVERRDWSTSFVYNSKGPSYIRKGVTVERANKVSGAPGCRRRNPGAEAPSNGSPVAEVLGEVLYNATCWRHTVINILLFLLCTKIMLPLLET